MTLEEKKGQIQTVFLMLPSDHNVLNLIKGLVHAFQPEVEFMQEEEYTDEQYVMHVFHILDQLSDETIEKIHAHPLFVPLRVFIENQIDSIEEISPEFLSQKIKERDITAIQKQKMLLQEQIQEEDQAMLEKIRKQLS